ncbi:O-glucosyltransferase rumi [Drosophila busckii]|uniref:O-glucosyltransferase rumi n=1 Tax=Drosophila busckii TaxID=30019 RepID=UPI00083F3CBD|nr:O-glucosyltransferase rumi [Drosophila busckii]
MFLVLCCVIILSENVNAATENQACSEGETICAAPNVEKKLYAIKQRIAQAMANYESCSTDVADVNCTCHAAVIKKDLAPYKSTGLSRKMLENAAKYGTRYKIYKQQLYRDENCMFPARCQGIEHFLLQLLPQLPDMDLVINTRDYPQLQSAFRGQDAAVFSFSKTQEHHDIMYPAWTFWAGGPATKLHPTGIGRWDLMREKLRNSADAIAWNDKQALGFFRGSRTSDERDSLVLLSRRRPELVNAQYTKNQAWKSLKDTLNQAPAQEASFEDHCQYKYLFNFRGVAASFRLKHLFLCKSLVFHVGDEWQEFFYPQLKPWVHYVPLQSYPSEQQYEELIEFFKNHDELAQQIATNGYDFIWQHLRMEDISCYWRKLLKRYKKLLKYEVQPDKQMKFVGGAKDEL